VGYNSGHTVQQIGRYQILGELGRGAMGVVYRAQDPAIGRTIAIKTIRLSDLTDPGERERLRERLFREAQSAGILSHPNIVTIYDILEEGGLAYIFMEFVNGAPLEKLLTAAQSPDKNTLLSILRQTAGALDYAHKKGIVHRDIKPANIMIHEDGTPKVTDFGVAKILSQQMTQSGTMMGTPSYMSPEQVQGADVDGRADQFALAVIAYEMLTGERPFIADYLPSLLYKICREDFVPPQRLNTTLAPAVDGVFKRALAKEAKDRYPTCAECVDDLERACNMRTDWVPLARGTSLNMPTVGSRPPGMLSKPDKPSPDQNNETIGFVIPPVVSAEKPAPAVASISSVLDPVVVKPREPVRLEETETHTVRNVVLAVASIIVVGVIVLLAQQWFAAPKPTATAAENTSTTAASDASKPSPSPSKPMLRPMPDPAAQTAASQSGSEPALNAGEPTRTKPVVPSKAQQAAGDTAAQFITSPPGARVLVDGNPQFSCRAPCSLTLVPGRHTMLVQAEGYRDANRIFEIPRDANLSVDMDRNGGTLSITSNLVGSTIVINGQERPEKTPALITLPVGTYQVHLVNGKLQCEADPVKILDGSIARRTCDMQ
jgi:serine/threonine protein kinase